MVFQKLNKNIDSIAEICYTVSIVKKEGKIN